MDDQNQNSAPATTDPQVNPLDQMIKDKFKLFQGLRSQEEDQKIYDKVTNLCFDEIMLFLSENLSESGKENLDNELTQQENEEAKLITLTRYLSTIENSERKLGARMEAFLSNLLHSTVSK